MTSPNERRTTPRELVLANGVECHTTLPGGAIVIGAIHDSSVGGVRIDAPCPGLAVDTNVELLFVFPTGEKVAYKATVVHVNVEFGCFGVRFDSDPIPIEVHPPME